MQVETDVVLLAPEEEPVPEHALHQRLVDLLWAGLAARFAERDDVAVHARLAWFPDREDTGIRLDPDVLIAFGRPPAPRSSWRAWDEDGVAPTVIVEVWSEHDTDAEYRRRLGRARRYGVEEVVVVDPFSPGGVRVEHLVADPADPAAWRTAAVSVHPDRPVALPRLGIGMAGGPKLVVTDPQGAWLDTPAAVIAARAEAARADAEAARADAEAARADAEAARAGTEAARAERLAARLRAAGLDPDA